jgi:hypothetical protein
VARNTAAGTARACSTATTGGPLVPVLVVRNPVSSPEQQCDDDRHVGVQDQGEQRHAEQCEPETGGQLHDRSQQHHAGDQRQRHGPVHGGQQRRRHRPQSPSAENRYAMSAKEPTAKA